MQQGIQRAKTEGQETKAESKMTPTEGRITFARDVNLPRNSQRALHIPSPRERDGGGEEPLFYAIHLLIVIRSSYRRDGRGIAGRR